MEIATGGPLRLRRLELRGFKTFANPTELEFHSPITAIVGPNGSGKSNIADAIRWVLGTQSPRTLRSRSTEDIIFAGSSLRPPLGMAEVAITLDNADGWLALPYAEVTVARRAYRSGENEYLLNKGRVLWRELTEILLKANLSPNGYTVIGQGAVDAALSLRPEERLDLLEEAADIKRHRTKLVEAQAKLALTDQNLQRVQDLLGELGPRLTALEKQARRAQEHAALGQELHQLLAAWYSHLWEKASQTLAGAEEEARQAEEGAAAAQACLDQRVARAAALRARLQEQQTELAAWQQEYQTRREEAEALGRQRAVMEERLAALRAREQEAAEEEKALAAQIAQAAAHWAAGERRAQELAEANRRAQGNLAAAEAAVEACQKRRQERQDRLAAAEAKLSRLAEQAADLHHELARLVERQRWAAKEDAEGQRAAQRHQEQLRSLEEQHTALAERLEGLRREHQAAAEAAEEAQRAVEDSLAAQARARQALEEAQRQQILLRTRLEALAGAPEAVPAVLYQGGRRGNLTTIARLLRTPPELERAVEAALDGCLHGIVTPGWASAMEAIALLKRTAGGRATFLPLDTLHLYDGASPLPFPLRAEGILGIASELVTCEDERYRAVVRYLLGRTLVVEDLQAARRILPACPQGWQIVTREGDLVRHGGAVAGGSPVTRGSALAHWRERRELPLTLRRWEAQQQALEQELAAQQLQHAGLVARASAQAQGEKELRAALQAALVEQQAMSRHLERAREEAACQRAQNEQRRKETESLAQRKMQLEQAWESAAAERDRFRQSLETLRQQGAQEEAQERELHAAASEGRTSLALMEQEVMNLAGAQEGRRALLKDLQARRGAKEMLHHQMGGAVASLSHQIEDEQVAEGVLVARLTALEALIGPAQAKLRQAEEELRALEEQEPALRAHLREKQEAHRHAALALERARHEQQALRQQIARELGDREEPPFMSPSVLAHSIPADHLSRRIDELRKQLRALGSVDPQVVGEYEEVAARHRFLTAQAQDLEQAGRSLRRGLAELDRLMRQRFHRTFAAVAAEFKAYFQLLFGGGTARLVLTQPHDLSSSGIEILAQPPGRRAHGLHTLSGGERALTAVALLFALLRVNPAPLCVLDEVDATLDEANIARFGEALRGLAAQTQFLIITHSRGTMVTAGALYGITMGEDSVSRVLSLRLAGAEDAVSGCWVGNLAHAR